MFLQAIAEGKTILLDWRLENVQPTIKDDLPASVGGDIARMARTGTVENPSEFNTCACADVGYGIQKPALLGDVAVIRSRYQVNADLVLWRLALDNHFDKFHHVLDPVKIADTGIGHYDPGCTGDIGAKYLGVADTFAVFSEDMMAFGKRLYFRCGTAGFGSNGCLVARDVSGPVISILFALLRLLRIQRRFQMM